MRYTHSEQEMMTKMPHRNANPGTSGIVLHSPRFYDFTVWFFLLGRERRFRETLVRLARLGTGESVLDIGCGTGTLAIAAKRQVGPGGAVYGVDASLEMIARAEKKARKCGAEILFKSSLAEQLPFPDHRFDVVFSTMMLHHLPRKTRVEFAREVRRVLKPSGRVLIVDFEGIADQKRTFLSHFHRPHGHVAARDIVTLLGETGFSTIDSGAVGVRDLQFVLASPYSS